MDLNVSLTSTPDKKKLFVYQVLKSLEQKCFSIIDKFASYVLESDEFEDIGLELLKDIIKRDSLQIQSGETILLFAHFLRVIYLFRASNTICC